MTDLQPPRRRPSVDQQGELGRNTGHGHVYPRPDRVITRCGGPSLCATCRGDVDRLNADATEALAAALPITDRKQAFSWASTIRRRLLTEGHGWVITPLQPAEASPGRTTR